MDIRPIEVYRLELSVLRRGRFSQPAADEIALARELGVLPPVVARPKGPTASGARPNYEILSGEKSWFIAQALAMHTVDVQVHEVDDEAAARIARSGSPGSILDQVAAIDAALHAGPRTSIAKLARIQGMTRSNLSHRYRLRRLAPEVQVLVERGVLAQGKARALVTLPVAEQVRIARRAVSERLSTRQVEALARAQRTPASVAAAVPAVSAAKPAGSDSPEVRQLMQQLSERLGCAAALSEGKLVINYYNDLEILQGVLEQLGIAEGGL